MTVASMTPAVAAVHSSGEMGRSLARYTLSGSLVVIVGRVKWQWGLGHSGIQANHAGRLTASDAEFKRDFQRIRRVSQARDREEQRRPLFDFL